MYCIYKITNTINGKTYIGQHQYTDENNPMGKYTGSGKILHLAYKKYGFSNFKIEVMYSRIRDKLTVDAMEVWAIAKYKPEYNIAKGGNGGDIAGQLDDEAYKHFIQKLSENSYFKGKRYVPKEYMSDSEYDEYLQKISETNRKVVHTQEWNAKVSKTLKEYFAAGNHGSNFGVNFTEEHKSKISKSRKGYRWFNNGIVTVQAKECPEGFVPGMGPEIKERMKQERARRRK